MSMHSLRSWTLRNEAPDIHDWINTCGCQTVMVEDARMANSILMLIFQRQADPYQGSSRDRDQSPLLVEHPKRF